MICSSLHYFESCPSRSGSDDIFLMYTLLIISFIPFICPHLNLSVTWVHRPFTSDEVLSFLRSGKLVLCRTPISTFHEKYAEYTCFFLRFLKFGQITTSKTQYLYLGDKGEQHFLIRFMDLANHIKYAENYLNMAPQVL